MPVASEKRPRAVRMHAVASSGIAAIGYDRKGKSLLVRYRRESTIYVYMGVRLETYAQLMQAESKGRFVNLYIKPRYDFQRFIGAQTAEPQSSEKAVAKLKELRRGTLLGGLSWKALRDAGRP